MTPEKEKELQAKLETIYKMVMIGDEETPSLRSSVNKLLKQNDRIITLLKGIGIGIILGALILGFITLKDAIHLIK